MIVYNWLNNRFFSTKYLKILFIFFILVSCSHKQESVIISGITEGIPDQEIDLMVAGENTLLKTSKIENGKFKFETTLEKPATALNIKFKDEKYVLYPIRNNSPLGMMLVDNGNSVEITIKVDTSKTQKEAEYIYPEVLINNGSQSYKLYSKFREKLNKKFEARANELDSLFNSLNIDWSNFKKEDLDTMTKRKLKKVQVANVKLSKEKIAYLKTSIIEQSNDLEGIFILYEFGTFINPNMHNKESWPKWYDGLDEVVKTTHLSQAFKKKMEKDKQTKAMDEQVSVGKYFKDFTLPDQNGKEVTLSSFLGDGNYVLLDFWASWCGPCRQENPNVLKAYNKYKDNGLIVVAVSLDKNKKLWLKAIKEDGMPWVHLSDLLAYKSEVVKNYGITGIPANFLLNADGKIVAKNLRDEKLHSTLEEIFTQISK